MKELQGLQRLRELFTQKIEEKGGRVETFAVFPIDVPEVHVLITLDEDLFKDEEQRAVDDEFAELEKRLREETIEEQSVDAVKGLADLEERLKDSTKGILDDD